MNKMVLTALESVTPVGFNAETTAASVRAGLSRLRESGNFWDSRGNPILEASPGVRDEETDELKSTRDYSRICLENLLRNLAQHRILEGRKVEFFLGCAVKTRPGPRYEERFLETLDSKELQLKSLAERAGLQIFRAGNAAVIKALQHAQQLLAQDSSACCIVGGIDSLLDEDTLRGYEQAARLKSSSMGRSQGLIPAAAAGFLLIESQEYAIRAGRPVIARLSGVGCATDPSSFSSGSPNQAKGLTEACSEAMTLSGTNPEEITAVFTDLSGERFHAREWNLAEIRCFQNASSSRQLWHPADCMGSVGAASGAILIGIASSGLARGWIRPAVLVTCSDDNGDCGAVVIGK